MLHVLLRKGVVLEIALVHGSYHGAWCWDFLRPELERLGHRVVTIDLPISDPTLGAADYAAAIDDALDPRSEPMIVGHSMAGLVIPLVAARRPVRRLVFLAAYLPVPGKSANDQRATERIDGQLPPKISQWTDLGDDVWMIGPRTATELFYHDAPAAVARWATQRLRLRRIASSTRSPRSTRGRTSSVAPSCVVATGPSTRSGSVPQHANVSAWIPSNSMAGIRRSSPVPPSLPGSWRPSQPGSVWRRDRGDGRPPLLQQG